jgi:DNA-binding beta-propeller fold protein YncE
LTVIDVAASKEIKRISVGAFANGIALSPDEKYAFVGCEDEGKTHIKPDGDSTVTASAKDSDGVHVIDMKTLEVVSIIKTGLGPDTMLMWYPAYQ